MVDHAIASKYEIFKRSIEKDSEREIVREKERDLPRDTTWSRVCIITPVSCVYEACVGILYGINAGKIKLPDNGKAAAV